MVQGLARVVATLPPAGATDAGKRLVGVLTARAGRLLQLPPGAAGPSASQVRPVQHRVERSDVGRLLLGFPGLGYAAARDHSLRSPEFLFF